MTVSLTLIISAAVLIGSGVYLMLERSLTRVLVGLVLLSNGVSLCFLISAGPAGEAPIITLGRARSDMADSLPQALVLTAIVITLGTISFLLAMAHRIWQLGDSDDVQDDIEDAAIRQLAISNEVSGGYEAAGQDDEDLDEAHPDVPLDKDRA